MKSSILCLIIMLVANSLPGQSKQDYVWLLGRDKSSSELDLGYRIDFNDTFSLFKSNNGCYFDSNNASICDKNGKLLFYTNGCSILNRNGEMMENGDSINHNQWYDLYWEGNCEYGYPGFQDIMILPDPGFEDGFYVFHKANVYVPQAQNTLELLMSYVDMSLDQGLGDVVFKNQPYYEGFDLLYSYFTSINHMNGHDWWIIQPLEEDSLFLAYLLTENGLVKYENQNSQVYFTRFRSSASGTAKFSPDGNKYALYNFYDQLHIYDFDRTSGLLSNHIKINVYPEDSIDINEIRFSSLEWSPNSRFIYAASSMELFQIDTWEDNIQENGIQLIDIYNGKQDPFSTTFFLMALAPDCRIYMCPTSQTNSYHVINNPNEEGYGCNFVQNGLKLPLPSGVASMPNFPRFRVDDDEKCDPTIVSVFGDAIWYRRDLKVYPNPSNGIFNIELPELLEGDLIVSDIHSNLIQKQTINLWEKETRIDISYFPTGLYNIEIYPINNPERVFYSTQVMKE